VYAGFAHWWLPYLYVWTVLWGITMLLPKKMPIWLAAIVYPVVCSLHGFAFGIIYAPGQALLYSYNFEQTIAWIASGFAFDIIHGISNIFTGMLVLPFSQLIRELIRRSGRDIC
jgi:energy-coupling factor transport system substrate-specific component